MVWQLSSVVLDAGPMVVRCRGPMPCCPRSARGDSPQELQLRGKGLRELFWVDILIVGSEGYVVPVVLSDYPCCSCWVPREFGVYT